MITFVPKPDTQFQVWNISTIWNFLPLDLMSSKTICFVRTSITLKHYHIVMRQIYKNLNFRIWVQLIFITRVVFIFLFTPSIRFLKNQPHNFCCSFYFLSQNFRILSQTFYPESYFCISLKLLPFSTK